MTRPACICYTSYKPQCFLCKDITSCCYGEVFPCNMLILCSWCLTLPEVTFMIFHPKQVLHAPLPLALNMACLDFILMYNFYFQRELADIAVEEIERLGGIFK